MLQKNIAVKALIIAFLALLFLIPLGLVQGIVSEREASRYSAKRNIASSWTGPQNVYGPLLVVEYKEDRERQFFNPETGKTEIKKTQVERRKYLLPEELSISGVVSTEERYRGIYSFPVYTSKLKIEGSFTIPAHLGIDTPIEKITWDSAFLVLGIQDIRGIADKVSLSWAGEQLNFEPGADGLVLKCGVKADIKGIPQAEEKSYRFSANVDLQGMERISFAPFGKTTEVALSSSWPHPKFIGRFLPVQRDISDEGFQAQWKTTHFATNSPQLLEDCIAGNCSVLMEQIMGVELYQPVDVYQRTERSLKYGILFVALTFLFFFLYEVLKALRVHPIQYGLVGLALAVFYLLLVSLSEHVAFSLAYGIASCACILLLTFYVSFVLGGFSRGLGFGAVLGVIYAKLYLLLLSEDYALLLGSALLFSVLCLVMVLTRKIDWYQVGTSNENRQDVENSAE